MPSAQERALSTPEVLELILVQLPLEDLLINVQRVNHLFHDIITSSHPLQQALFFRPMGPKNPLNGKVRMNPILQKKFPPWFEVASIMPHMVGLSNRKHFLTLDWNRSKERTDAYARKEASWRRMLVSQPPIDGVDMKMSAETMLGASPSKGELKPKDGLRMGSLYDIVEDFIAHHYTSYFAIQWHPPPVLERECGEVVQYITIFLKYVIHSQLDVAGRIGPEFKSLGFESVDFDYHPVHRSPPS